jgi:hypothetical protein
MAEDLEANAARWAQARQLREFLNAYEAGTKPSGAALEWLAAARGYADAIDPLVSDSVARELEPTDEVLEDLIAQEKAIQSRSRST